MSIHNPVKSLRTERQAVQNKYIYIHSQGQYAPDPPASIDAVLYLKKRPD